MKTDELYEYSARRKAIIAASDLFKYGINKTHIPAIEDSRDPTWLILC